MFIFAHMRNDIPNIIAVIVSTTIDIFEELGALASILVKKSPYHTW
jgi:hypothetical protein